MKSDRDRGYYLFPELFDQPEEKSIQWARNPELMKKAKDRREEQRKQAQADGNPSAARARSSESKASGKGAAGNN